MALAASTYGTVADVARMIGERTISGTFSNGVVGTGPDYLDSQPATSPTLTEVETALDRAANMLNARLYAAGYATPIDASCTDAYGWAQEANAALVAARILNREPIRRVDLGDGENETDARVASYHGQVQDFLEAADGGALNCTRRSDSTSRTGVGYNTPREPIFTVGMMSEVG